MDQFTKEGRKLRPRRSAGSAAPRAEKVEYRPGEGRSYNEHKSYSEGRSGYGENRGGGYGRPQHRGQFSRTGSSSGHSQDRRGGYEGRPSSGQGQRPSRPGSSRPGFASKPRFGQKPGAGRGGFAPKGAPARKKAAPGFFNKESNAGIERMISRRPVVNGNEAVANEFEAPISNEIRLNKFIANSGVCSRREADTLIQAGVVTVNGQVVTELGVKVNIFEDDIRFNGERLKGEEKVYIVMNKPKGFVTTSSDPHAEKTVIDLLKSCQTRVYPVGRLDKNTTGVLMLTNDGEIAERLTHPSYDKKKIYQVALDKPLAAEDYEKILSGLTLTDGEVKADELEYIDENDHRKLGIEIHSGKNRIVRRIFESLGYSVKALDRVYFAGLTKKGLKKGEWRYLTEGEVNILKMGAYI